MKSRMAGCPIVVWRLLGDSEMLDAETAKLSRIGEIVITKTGILVHGFSGDGCSCRDTAALAALWAIGELQRELMATLQKPGGGKICVQ
jgi:hypothetical protein